MITLKEFREFTKDLPEDTPIAIKDEDGDFQHALPPVVKELINLSTIFVIPEMWKGVTQNKTRVITLEY